MLSAHWNISSKTVENSLAATFFSFKLKDSAFVFPLGLKCSNEKVTTFLS